MNTFNTNNIEQKIRIKIDYSKTLEKTLLEMSTKNAEKQNPFFLVDLACLSRKLKHWEKTFPFVKPFYAVKCNPDEKIVSVLEKMGVNFDCASCSEMQFLLRKKNFDSRRIIFANPHKSQKEIKFALSNKVFLMTFDCKEELNKIVDAAKSFKNFENILNKIRIVLRIKVDNPKALNKLNEKYGAPLETIDQIIEETKRLKLVLEGISFHVGSGCYDANAYVNVLENAKYAFQKAKQLCSPLKILDIGGGFPGGSHGGFMVNGEHDKIFLEEIGNVFDEKMNTSLSFLKDLTVISEPGRFFVESCQTLVVTVVSRKILHNKIKYYLNHGVYGAFKDAFLLKTNFKPKLLSQGDEKLDLNQNLAEMDFGAERCSYFYGPTRSEEDLVSWDQKMPFLKIGALLYFTSMGAYTSSISSKEMEIEEVETFYVWIENA